MAKDEYKLPNHTKILLCTELFIIYINALICFLLIAYTFILKNDYMNSLSKSFLFTVRERILNNIYYSDITITDDYLFNTGNDGGCPMNYDTHRFFSFKEIANVSLLDVTNNLTLIDKMRSKIENQTVKLQPELYGQNYYEFDIEKVGNDTIIYMNYNAIYSWRKKVFCSLRLKLDEDYSAFRLIPSKLLCKSLEIFNNYKSVVDCGVYQNTYRLCIISDLVEIDFLGKNIDKSKLNDTDFCPLVDFDMKYEKNKYYNKYNLSSNEYNISLSLYKNIYLSSKFFEPRNKNSIYSSLDNFLTFENNFYDLYNPEDDVLISHNHPNYVRDHLGLTEYFGLRDSFSTIIDKYEFFKFYNDTYCRDKEVLGYSQNKNISLLMTAQTTEFLSDELGKNFFRPYVKSNRTKIVEIYLSKYNFPSFSGNCYFNVFAKYTDYDAFTQLNNMSLKYLDETIYTIIAWEMTLLFIYLWGCIKTRSAIVLSILKMEGNDADIKSDSITKLTFKTATFLVMGIIFKGIITQKNGLRDSLNISTNLIQYDCFNNSIKRSLKKLKEFTAILEQSNQTLFYLFTIMVINEIVISMIYMMYSKLNHSPVKIQENKTDN